MDKKPSDIKSKDSRDFTREPRVYMEINDLPTMKKRIEAINNANQVVWFVPRNKANS